MDEKRLRQVFELVSLALSDINNIDNKALNLARKRLVEAERLLTQSVLETSTAPSGNG